MKNEGFRQLENSLNPLFAEALKNNVFSGAVAAVFSGENKDEKRCIKAFGLTRNDKKGKRVEENTIFDLASLTKPLCTTLCILSLMEEEKIDWQSPLYGLIPYKINADLKKIKVEQLLSHSAGLIDYRPYFKDFEPVYKRKNKKLLIEKIIKEPLIYVPGTKCLYSDMGFIILGEIIEYLSGEKLNDYFEKKISGPWELAKDIFFISLEKDKNVKENTAATELCPWRRKLLQGEVHDEHCWLMSGVAGHAGLFGTGEAVLTLTERLLAQWLGQKSHPAYSNLLLQAALNTSKPGQTWAMGFDRPSMAGSSAGKYISRNSVGHLGYTGTSFWIDPDRKLIVVLLTNRVHPSRENKKIQQFRPIFHDTVIESLDLQ